MLNPNRLLFSNTFYNITQSAPLILADAGARGGLEEPWACVNKNAIQVIGFEPDQAECEQLNAQPNSNIRYIPKALWSHQGEIEFHLANIPSTSSVPPPNFDYIKCYDKSVWESRQTDKILKVNCTSLDTILQEQNSDCDFLKIDTHGAEYDILLGAAKALESKITGVLVETWSAEIHRGQKLTGDIMVKMKELGFDLFNIGTAAAWPRQTTSQYQLHSKSQIVGLDLLFMREPVSQANAIDQPAKLIKAAAIAEVYGFVDYAVEILTRGIKNIPEHSSSLTVARDQILTNSNIRHSLGHKIKRRLSRYLGKPQQDFASLHYYG